MDGGAWQAAVHGVATSRTWLNDFTFTFHFHALENEMATHSSALAWRIPGMGEPGGLPSLGSHRVGHDWSDLAAAAVQSLNGVVSCVNISSGLKEKKHFMWLKLRNVEKKKFVLSSSLRIPDPYLLLENPRPLCPRGPLDFLSTCPGIDSQNL